MTFNDSNHKERIDYFFVAWDGLTDIEELAESYDIYDIAQDNNLKLLQTLVMFDFKNQANREGADAIDRYGHLWELKTVNLNLTKSFSTNHHTNLERIEVFRKERWLFSAYEGIRLKEVYAVAPCDLEEYFSKWEEKVLQKIEEGTDNAHLNNPKIPLKYVREVGTLVYPVPEPIDSADVLRRI